MVHRCIISARGKDKKIYSDSGDYLLMLFSGADHLKYTPKVWKFPHFPHV